MFKELPKAVVLLSFASLFGDIASEAIYPILPLFLTSTLGVSALYLGALEGIAEAIASLTKLFSGYLSDKTNQKSKIVFIGYAISTCRSLIGLATTPLQILGIRFSDRLGKGIRTAPRDSWLASYTNPQNRGRIFGFHRGMDHLGATIAPLLATVYLYFYPGQYRILFLLTFIPGFLTLYYIWKARNVSDGKESIDQEPKEKIKLRDAQYFSKSFWYFLFVIFIFTLGNSADAFLILRLKDIGIPEYLIPLLWGGLNLVKMLSTFWGGGFSDRIGSKTAIMMGWLIYALAYFAFASLTNPILIAMIFLSYGIFFGLTEAPEKSLVTALVPARLRGTAFGFYHLISGVGLLPASLLCGYLWTKYGAPTALLFGAALAFISVILILPLSSRPATNPKFSST